MFLLFTELEFGRYLLLLTGRTLVILKSSCVYSVRPDERWHCTLTQTMKDPSPFPYS